MNLVNRLLLCYSAHGPSRSAAMTAPAWIAAWLVLAQAANPLWLDAAEMPPAAARPIVMPALVPQGNPQPWPVSMIAPALGRTHLPAHGFGRQPFRAEVAKIRDVRMRPAIDLPTVAWNSGISLPSPRLLPARPPAYAPSPDPERLTQPWVPTVPDTDRPRPQSDPVLDRGQQALLGVLPELRPNAAPLLRLRIPDPFEIATPVKFSEPPPDSDPPSSSSAMPPKPLLPALPPKP